MSGVKLGVVWLCVVYVYTFFFVGLPSKSILFGFFLEVFLSVLSLSCGSVVGVNLLEGRCEYGEITSPDYKCEKIHIQNF